MATAKEAAEKAAKKIGKKKYTGNAAVAAFKSFRADARNEFRESKGGTLTRADRVEAGRAIRKARISRGEDPKTGKPGGGVASLKRIHAVVKTNAQHAKEVVARKAGAKVVAASPRPKTPLNKYGTGPVGTGRLGLHDMRAKTKPKSESGYMGLGKEAPKPKALGLGYATPKKKRPA